MTEPATPPHSSAAATPDSADRTRRLVAVSLDPASIRRGNPNVEHEREVAIYDLIEDNAFGVPGRADGPYKLTLAIVEDRLVFDIKTEADAQVVTHVLSLSPLRRVLRDYFIVCDSYYQAIRTAPASRIQAIDMGRRGLHDEGSKILAERLAGKVEVDHATARRLFTLIGALHWKG